MLYEYEYDGNGQTASQLNDLKQICRRFPDP